MNFKLKILVLKPEHLGSCTRDNGPILHTVKYQNKLTKHSWNPRFSCHNLVQDCCCNSLLGLVQNCCYNPVTALLCCPKTALYLPQTTLLTVHNLPCKQLQCLLLLPPATAPKLWLSAACYSPNSLLFKILCLLSFCWPVAACCHKVCCCDSPSILTGLPI
jgi:hypothetical protein